jgi:hypothetical protein
MEKQELKKVLRWLVSRIVRNDYWRDNQQLQAQAAKSFEVRKCSQVTPGDCVERNRPTAKLARDLYK